MIRLGAFGWGRFAGGAKPLGSVLDIDTWRRHSHCPVVARKLRVEYPGAIYHVMSRGDRRELIFHDQTDRQRFVQTTVAIIKN